MYGSSGVMEAPVAETGFSDAQPDDIRLLRRFTRGGDRDALGALLVRHSTTAYRLARGYFNVPADAEDAVQTAFVQVLRCAGEFDERRGASVEAWIMGFIIGACRNKVREDARRAHRHDEVGKDAALTVTHEPLDRDVLDAVFSALRALPDHYRIPVWLCHYQGYSARDAAAVLSVPEETVRKQIQRGIERLRASLSSAGFAVSATGISAALAGLPIEATPASVAGSIPAILSHAAAHGAAGAGATTAATAKGAALTVSAKWTLGAVALAGVVAVIAGMFTWAPRIETSADGNKPLVAAPVSDALPRDIDPALAAILNSKSEAVYHRDYFGEVLALLSMSKGLHSAIPKPLSHGFMLTLEDKPAPVKQLVATLAAMGKLELEYHGSEVVFWKKADDALLLELEKKLKEGDVEARCEAVYDLAQLADKRIYPPLFRALRDPDDAVVANAILQLAEQHEHTLRYGAELPTVVEPLTALLAAPRMAAYKNEVMTILAATRIPAAADPLLALLKENDESVRSKAAEALAHVQEPRAAGPLLELLKDPSKHLSQDAAFLLGMMEGPKTADVLLSQLAHADASVRSRAVLALAATQDPRALANAIALVKDPDPGVRMIALQALGNLHDPKAVDALLAILKDTKADENVRTRASLYIGNTRDPHGAEQLIALLKSSDPVLRASAAVGVANSFDTRAVEPLIALLKDSDANVRTCAASALSLVRNTKATEAAVGLLKGADLMLSMSTIQYFPNSRDPKAVEALIERCKDKDPMTRVVAINMLSREPGPEAVDTMIAVLKEKPGDPSMKLYAALGLGNVHEPRALEPLLSMLKDRVPSIASETVGFSQDPNAKPPLVPPVVVASLSLASSKDPRAVNPLIALTTDKDASVRLNAARALGQSRDPRTVEPLAALLKDPQKAVRDMAELSLKMRTDVRAVAALDEYKKSKSAPKPAPKAEKPPAPPADF